MAEVRRETVRLLAEGGPAIGMGHLARSSALARAVELRGFGVEALGVGLEETVELDGVVWQPAASVPVPGDEALVVCDGYGLPPALGAYRGRSVAALHERWDEAAPDRVAWLEIGGQERDGALTGLGHACLRAPFWSVEPYEGETDRDPRRILVSTGGGDSAARADRLAVKLLAHDPSLRVSAVSGPFSEPVEADGVDVLRAPPDLRAAFDVAGVVVSAGGQTLLESIACGRATIALPLVPDQVPQVRLCAERGCVAPSDLDGVTGELASLIADPARRRALEAAARKEVDGLGAHRLALAFLRAGGFDGRRFPGPGGVDLRPATAADSAFLLSLRNDPAVRERSRSTAPVADGEHRAWFEASLRSPSRHLFVIEVAGDPVGQLRLDTGDAECELSISLTAAARGRGLGGSAIRTGVIYAFSELGQSRVEARVGESNSHSLRAFERAGFAAGVSGEDGFRQLLCSRRTLAWSRAF